jgi:hypothetical protein
MYLARDPTKGRMIGILIGYLLYIEDTKYGGKERREEGKERSREEERGRVGILMALIKYMTLLCMP